MAFKAKLPLATLLLLALALLSTILLSQASAKEDYPELQQCLHHCSHQRHFDKSQQERCERACRGHYEQKHQGGDRGGRSEEEGGSKNKDPERELRECRRQCNRREGEREKEWCGEHCRQRYVVEGRGHDQEEEEERWGREGEGDNPYVFENFSTVIETQQGNVGILQRFDERSELLEGIRGYRLSILEADPYSFVLPSHGDAEVISFVSQGNKKASMMHF